MKTTPSCTWYTFSCFIMHTTGAIERWRRDGQRAPYFIQADTPGIWLQNRRFRWRKVGGPGLPYVKWSPLIIMPKSALARSYGVAGIELKNEKSITKNTKTAQT